MNAQAEQVGDRFYGWVVLDGCEIVGTLGLEHVERDAHVQSAHIGYWITGPRRGRGIASKAVALALVEVHGGLEFHRIHANVQVGNLASHAVLERNDFERIGIARQLFKFGDVWRDYILYQHLPAG